MLRSIADAGTAPANSKLYYNNNADYNDCLRNDCPSTGRCAELH